MKKLLHCWNPAFSCKGLLFSFCNLEFLSYVDSIFFCSHYCKSSSPDDFSHPASMFFSAFHTKFILRGFFVRCFGTSGPYILLKILLSVTAAVELYTLKRVTAYRVEEKIKLASKMN